MRVADLTGALLDYWVARAEGVPASQLEIREVPRTDLKICVRLRTAPAHSKTLREAIAVNYSTNWALTGPLVEKHSMGCMEYSDGGWWAARTGKHGYGLPTKGDTPLIAICRAMVRAAFGDEVEDLP